MGETINLEQHLSEGVYDLIKNAMKATLKHPRESAFLAQYALHAKKAGDRRHQAELRGEHIPSFLIASITDTCNLQCAGCYAHANAPATRQAEMTSAQWGSIFMQAVELGVSMILLAGGEPLMRRDVLEEAVRHPQIIFPVFTNGTLLKDGYASLFYSHRNLVPILSVEGDEHQTDTRRGQGAHAVSMAVMEQLRVKALLFGASITVTRENLQTVTDAAYVQELRKRGCNIVLYVEYVPVEREELALNDEERAVLTNRVQELRQLGGGIVVSFPGDEQETGGCLAAGRGFFHINARGGAEPCPFSPYSDTSLKDVPLKAALQSPLFVKLREGGHLEAEHRGGCTLFDQAEDVSRLVGV